MKMNLSLITLTENIVSVQFYWSTTLVGLFFKWRYFQNVSFRIFILYSFLTLELSPRTNLSVYTTSIIGTRHVWSNNGSFGDYGQKQYFFPNERQTFVCCFNVTIKRYEDQLLRGAFKRREYIYKIELDGYRRTWILFLWLNIHLLTINTFHQQDQAWAVRNPIC